MTTTPEESLFEFPCSLPIKVFGRNDASFRSAALGIVRSHYADVGDEAIGEQLSRRGSYLSLTITVQAESREEVDALYRELSASDEILMVL